MSCKSLDSNSKLFNPVRNILLKFLAVLVFLNIFLDIAVVVIDPEKALLKTMDY